MFFNFSLISVASSFISFQSSSTVGNVQDACPTAPIAGTLDVTFRIGTEGAVAALVVEPYISGVASGQPVTKATVANWIPGTEYNWTLTVAANDYIGFSVTGGGASADRIGYVLLSYV